MKTLALLLTLATTAQADNEWRTSDTVREGIWLAVHIADTATTVDVARQPDHYIENNPLIGPHPSPHHAIKMMALGAVAHAGISYALPHGWRDAWQYLTIGTSAYCVERNLSVGLRVRF